MMMLQYIVLDPNMSSDGQTTGRSSLFPMPAATDVRYDCSFDVEEVVITDMLGQVVLKERLQNTHQGVLSLRVLRAGLYQVRLSGPGGEFRTTLVKE